MKPILDRRATAGLSLIELMIALAIGSLLILGLVQVFAASRTAYQLSEGMARSQENGRFAIDYLQRDIRMAGHYGCVNDQSHLQTPGALVSHFLPKPATGATWGIDFPVSVRGYDATGTVPGSQLTLGSPAANWVPALPTAIAALNPLPGSDIIELRFLANEGVPVTTIATTATTTVITVPSARWDTLKDNGVANPTMFGLADCSYVDVFPATTSGSNTVTVAVPISRYTAQPVGQTMLYRAESMVYYIARGASGEPALFRARSNNTGAYLPAATAREELVEGIENMQILYGLDRVVDLATAPPSGYIDVQQPASSPVLDTPLAWRRVGAVQVGLLVRSPDPSTADQATAAGQHKHALGVEFVPSAVNDTKFRSTYEVTIAMRNRLYGN